MTDCNNLDQEYELLWRGSLLPLGGAAAPKPDAAVQQVNPANQFATAAQPSGSKLPRHKVFALSRGWRGHS